MSQWNNDLEYWAEQDAQNEAYEREMQDWHEWEERKISGNNPAPQSAAPATNPAPNPYADLF